MDEELRARLERSGYDRPEFAAEFDRYRPRPPSVLLELLPRLAGTARPKLVVDLGSGTGLSARPWAAVADEVVGVEPNEAMRTFAEQATVEPNVRYLGRSSYDTGLAAASADLVTAAQSLQWMRPNDVFPEIARILREGGFFCAYNYHGLSVAVVGGGHGFRLRPREKTRASYQTRARHHCASATERRMAEGKRSLPRSSGIAAAQRRGGRRSTPRWVRAERGEHKDAARSRRKRDRGRP
jgi:SAM-dependent methyltransferase